MEPCRAARLQKLILTKEDVVAHLIVKEIEPLEADCHLWHAAGGRIELESVGKVRAQQRLAVRPCLVLANPVLVEGVQEAHAANQF